MPKGTIRKLSDRGYGFIKCDTGGPAQAGLPL